MKKIEIRTLYSDTLIIRNSMLNILNEKNLANQIACQILITIQKCNNTQKSKD